MTIKNLNQVTPELYTSGRVRLMDAPELASLGVRSVLNVTLTGDPKWTFASHQDGAPDDGQPKPAEWFKDGINFVLNALKSGKVLIHCEEGVNRSPSMAYAVLRAQGMPEQQAAELVMRKCHIDHIRYQADAEKALAK